jgi:hypothetical protein
LKCLLQKSSFVSKTSTSKNNKLDEPIPFPVGNIIINDRNALALAKPTAVKFHEGIALQVVKRF